MNNIFTKTLSLVLIAELMIGGYPLQASAGAKEDASEITSPDQYLKELEKESEAIFGKNGCARINDKGEITVVNRTTTDAIQNENDQTSIDCKDRIRKHAARIQKAQKMIAEWKSQQTGDDANKNCDDCSVNPTGASTTGSVKSASEQDDGLAPEDRVCNQQEKNKIAKEIKTNSQCSMSCELKGSVKKTLGSTLGGWVVSSDKSCNVDKGGTSAGGCLADIVKSFFTSLASMGKAAWDGAVSAGKWIGDKVGGLFGMNKKVEKNATHTGKHYSKIEDKELKDAQTNSKKSNESMMTKITKGFSWIMEMVGFDVPVYKERWLCAGCGKRISVICDLVGVLGKDVVKNAIMIWVGGKVIQGAGKVLGKAISKTFGATKSLARGSVKLASKTKVGAAMVAWGAKGSARMSAKAAAGFESFMATKAGKASAYLAKATAKGGSKALNFVADGLQKVDDVMLYVPRLFVRGGKNVAAATRGMMRSANIFKKTPGLADDAVETGMKSVKDLPKDSPWEIEMPNQALTKEMAKSKQFIEQKFGKNSKGLTDDIQNAAESEFKNVGSAIKVETEAGSKFVKVRDPASVNRVLTYNEGKNAMVTMKDGSVQLFKEGKLVGEVKPKEASKIQSLVEGDPVNADDAALAAVRKNAEDSGLKVETPNSSSVSKKVEIDTKGACGSNISIQAGKAL
jgi:hypothetical protein